MQSLFFIKSTTILTCTSPALAPSAAKVSRAYITYGNNLTKTFQCHLNFIICSLAFSEWKRCISLSPSNIWCMHLNGFNLIKMCIRFCWFVFVDALNPLPIQIFWMILNRIGAAARWYLSPLSSFGKTEQTFRQKSSAVYGRKLPTKGSEEIHWNPHHSMYSCAKCHFI